MYVNKINGVKLRKENIFVTESNPEIFYSNRLKGLDNINPFFGKLRSLRKIPDFSPADIFSFKKIERKKKSNSPNEQRRNQDIVKKKVLLIDIKRLEERAQMISIHKWRNYIDWMAFQIAKDEKANGVLYFQNKKIVRMAGSIFFMKLKDDVIFFTCWDGLNDFEKKILEKKLRAIEKIFSKDSSFKSLNLTQRKVNITQLDSAEEVWALQTRSSIVAVSQILNSKFQSEKIGSCTTYLANQINSL